MTSKHVISSYNTLLEKNNWQKGFRQIMRKQS